MKKKTLIDLFELKVSTVASTPKNVVIFFPLSKVMLNICQLRIHCCERQVILK